MKQTLIFLFAMAAMAVLGACGHDEPEVKPDEIQTVDLEFYNRTIWANGVAFLHSTGTVEINNTQGTIRLTCDYLDADHRQHTLSTPAMRLYYDYDRTLSFEDTTCYSPNDGTHPHGMIDLDKGVIWYEHDHGSLRTVFTTYLSYTAYTQVTRLEDNMSIDHWQSSYLFAPTSADGDRCVMQINNFTTDVSGDVAADLVQFEGLPMTVTRDGYEIKTDKAESTYGPHYTITDVDIVISGQCRVINGSLVCNGHRIYLSGPLYR